MYASGASSTLLFRFRFYTCSRSLATDDGVVAMWRRPDAAFVFLSLSQRIYRILDGTEFLL